MKSANDKASALAQQLLTKAEAAERLAVSVRTVDRMRASGEIETVLVRSAVRVARSSIERLILSQLAPAETVEALPDPFAIPLLEDLKSEAAERRAKKLKAAA